MQRHAGGDEVEIGVSPPASPASITSKLMRCPAPSARLRRHSAIIAGATSVRMKRPIGIARDEVAAEQAGAAAELEHARALEVRQQAREPIRHGALQAGMLLVGLAPRAEARGDRGATAGEHGRIRGHDGRTIADASRAAHGRRPGPVDARVVCQMASLMAGGTMGSSRAARASMGQSSCRLRGLRVPVHQPIEPLVEALDVQRLRQGEAAAPQERQKA